MPTPHYRDVAEGIARATDEDERELDRSARALGRSGGTLPTPRSAAGGGGGRSIVLTRPTANDRLPPYPRAPARPWRWRRSAPRRARTRMPGPLASGPSPPDKSDGGGPARGTPEPVMDGLRDHAHPPHKYRRPSYSR